MDAERKQAKAILEELMERLDRAESLEATNQAIREAGLKLSALVPGESADPHEHTLQESLQAAMDAMKRKDEP